MQDAIGAAIATGYPLDELAEFFTQTGAIRTGRDGYVLTPEGQQWYEQEVAWLMSETE
jgi:hypothetical protein